VVHAFSLKYQFSKKPGEEHEQLHPEKVDEFYRKGIQRIPIIVARGPSVYNIIPEETTGVNNHT